MIEDLVLTTNIEELTNQHFYDEEWIMFHELFMTIQYTLLQIPSCEYVCFI